MVFCLSWHATQLSLLVNPACVRARARARACMVGVLCQQTIIALLACLTQQKVKLSKPSLCTNKNHLLTSLRTFQPTILGLGSVTCEVMIHGIYFMLIYKERAFQFISVK